jgi:hypothetical protein
MTLAGLQTQAAELRIQLTGLRAQWDGLRTQLDNMLRTNPARPGVQQKWADVGVQIAQVEGDLARTEAQISQRSGAPTGIPGAGTPSGPRGHFNQNLGFPIGAALLFAMCLPVSFAWARRVARGTPRPAPIDREQRDRLERIEQAIDAVAIEVERISEGQRFVTKIMAERASRGEPKESAQQNPPAEQQVRALGAGSAELLHIPERESVREKSSRD